MDKKEIVKKMTLREKADFLTGKAFFKTVDYPQFGIRGMYLSDGPHGLRKQAEAADHLGLHKSIPATCFPTASIMACSWDEELGERVGEALGKEAASMDVDMVLGPGLNIKRNPLCGRNFEYFSEDPYLAGKMAASYVRGIQSTHVNACIKHFAANNREFRRMTTDSVIDERTLREIYLTGFEIAVKEGKTNTVMTSYNRLNGTFTNENNHLMREILRGDWGFDGVVVTDWAGSNSRIEGLKAGNDLEMPACKYGADDLVKAVKAGEIPESLLDESVERILGLTEFSDDKEIVPFDVDAHHALARECAGKGMVLLENDGVLPLKEGTKVALIGDFAFDPRYQGAGSSIVNPTKLSTAQQALKETSLKVIAEERGFNRFGKKKKGLAKKAVKAAALADVVLYFAGLDEFSEAEGLDREHINMPENQKLLCQKLIATGKKVVVVLSCGSVVETDWADGAAAVLYAGLGGQAGAEAVADVLMGKVNPSGKLAESWVAKYDDCPTSTPALFPGEKDSTQYREGLFVGYRYFTSAGVKPKYPFGYGLSYTTFNYTDIKVSGKGATFTVTNTGAVAGDEIVQLYVGLPESKIVRPKRELKGFMRISLAPGESKEVTIPFTERTFAYFDVASNSWQVEAGDYDILIGASSEDIRLSSSLTVFGVTPESDLQKFPTYARADVKEIPDEEYYKLLGRTIEKETTGKKKRRLPVHENSTIGDLKFARGWTGRLFSWAIRFVIGASRKFGNQALANTMVMGMLHQPMRGLAKFGGMNRRQMEGLIKMFDGHFFKGLHQFLHKSKEEKAEIKAAKKQAKLDKKQAKLEKKNKKAGKAA